MTTHAHDTPPPPPHDIGGPVQSKSTKPAPPSYAPTRERRAPNLLDGADHTPYLASGEPKEDDPPRGPTVPTNYGDLDADSVINNRIGGVGVVHILADTEALKAQEAKAAAAKAAAPPPAESAKHSHSSAS